MRKVWVKQSDIAEAAGVSIATVDRVLNDRPGVSQRAINKIWDTVDQLQGENEARRKGDHPSLTFDLILPSGTNTFLNNMEAEAQLLHTRLLEQNVTIRTHRVKGFAPKPLVACMRAKAIDSDGMIVMALDNPLVHEAVHNLSDDGVPVVAIVSGLSTDKTLSYVGLNNTAAGRTAAYIMSMIDPRRPMKVALFEGSDQLAYIDHRERENGFRDALREYSPDSYVLAKRATQDIHEIAYQRSMELLQTEPEITGIYCMGGGARGIGRALRELRREEDITFICHEITRHTRDYLLDGTLNAILNQDPIREVNAAVEALMNHCRGLGLPQARIFVPTEIYFRENLP